MYSQEYVDRMRFMNPYGMENNLTIGDIARMLYSGGVNIYNNLRDFGGGLRQYRYGTPGFNNNMFQGGIVDNEGRLLEY